MKSTVIAEEPIADVPEANNGAGPLWCFGSRTIVRAGKTVFATERPKACRGTAFAATVCPPPPSSFPDAEPGEVEASGLLR